MRIYDFSTTTEFLKESFRSSKMENPSLTVERFARRLDLGSSTLKMILSGRRRPTNRHILSAARGLRLSHAETSYLETLTLKEGAKSRWERVYYAKILASKKREVKLTTIRSSKADLLSDPAVLPLLVYLMDRQGDGLGDQDLARELGISSTRVSELKMRLQRSDLLTKKSGGQTHLAFDKASHRHLQKLLLKRILAEAVQKIDSVYDHSEAFFVSYSYSATEESLKQIQMDLKHLMEKYMADSPSAEEGRVVARASFQVYPVIRA